MPQPCSDSKLLNDCRRSSFHTPPPRADYRHGYKASDFIRVVQIIRLVPGQGDDSRTHSGRSCARERGPAWWADVQQPAMPRNGYKIRAATAVVATAILILVAGVWVCPASAEDAIKPGKWEFWTMGSKIPEPPPGTQLPPSIRWGPEGMITSVCFSETNLKTPHSHMRTHMPRHGDLLLALKSKTKTRLGKGSCDFDVTTDATTATKSGSMNCAWSSGSKSNSEGVMHFHGDILDGTITSRYSSPNGPTTESSSTIKGRYVGPCDP
jgi:hypothetical protein